MKLMSIISLVCISTLLTAYLPMDLNSSVQNTTTMQQEGVEAAEMDTLTIKGVTYYLVFDEAQLRAIGTGKYGLDKNYMQQADIQMSTEEWKPIGTSEKPFVGTYTGNGFSIKGLTMKNPKVNLIGFFGWAEKAKLYNITLQDLDIKSAGSEATGGISSGAICAIAIDCNIFDNKVYPKE